MEPGGANKSPVVHIATDKYGRELYREELLSTIPGGPGQLIDSFQLLRAKRLAVLRGGGLGDLLMLMPVLSRVHEFYGHLGISLYCRAPYLPLFRCLPWLGGGTQEQYPAERFHYDTHVDLDRFVERHVDRTRMDRITLFSSAFGVGVGAKGVPFPVADVERADAKAYLHARFDRGPLVGLAPWGQDIRRSWPAQHARELCDKITNAGGNVIVFHNNPDSHRLLPTTDRVHVATGQDIPMIAALLQLCDVVVSVDTGIAHLAYAVREGKKPYLHFLFGMWDHKLRLNYMKNYFVQGPPLSVECYPCNEDKPFGSCQCECMTSITADMVWERGLNRVVER